MKISTAVLIALLVLGPLNLRLNKHADLRNAMQPAAELPAAKMHGAQGAQACAIEALEPAENGALRI